MKLCLIIVNAIQFPFLTAHILSNLSQIFLMCIARKHSHLIVWTCLEALIFYDLIKKRVLPNSPYPHWIDFRFYDQMTNEPLQSCLHQWLSSTSRTNSTSNPSEVSQFSRTKPMMRKLVLSYKYLGHSHALFCSSLWRITQLLTLSNGPRHTDEMAKYHVFDQDALDPLHWFAVVIKYGEMMVLAGWVFEEKKGMKSCGFPDFKTNVENQNKLINIKQNLSWF